MYDGLLSTLFPSPTSPRKLPDGLLQKQVLRQRRACRMFIRDPHIGQGRGEGRMGQRKKLNCRAGLPSSQPTSGSSGAYVVHQSHPCWAGIAGPCLSPRGQSLDVGGWEEAVLSGDNAFCARGQSWRS